MTNLSTTRVLIVDDDAAIRTLLAALMRREGLDFDLAENGLEAVERLAASHYDAVLLDLMMSRMTGLEVIEHVERTWPDLLPKCFIILTSASVRDLRQIEGKQFFRVVRKPFDMDDLISCIRECVRPREEPRNAG